MSCGEKLSRGFTANDGNFVTNFGGIKVKILFNIWRATLGRNVYVTNGRSACEAYNPTRDVDTNSAFALG
jgi:hypothetical protein